MRGVLAGSLLVGAIAFPWAARADDKQTCLRSYVDVQALRQDGKLRAARDATALCGRSFCPALIARDCVAWAAELDARIPTVVISVVDAAGRERPDAKATVDRATAPANGTAFSIDPGAHTVRCSLDGSDSIEEKIVVMEGEHDRPVHCEYSREGGKTTTQRRPPLPPTARPVPWPVYVTGSLAVAATGIWAYFGASALWGNPNISTSPYRDEHDRDLVHSRLVAADISGFSALAMGAVALLVYVYRPGTSAAMTGFLRGLSIGPMAEGAAFGWGARF